MERIGKQERELVLKVLDNNFRTSKSSELCSILESEFSEKFNVKYSVSFVNGTATLHTALIAAGVNPGDEVITTPLTMSSPSLAILQARAIPVFADIDATTFNIDPLSIEQLITSRTKAIIPVSLYGLPVDCEMIMRIAQKYNLVVIEDNAQCFLGQVNGITAGSLADIASYSFQSSKHMTCGEGGMLTTNNLDLANKIRKFSSLGYAGVEAKKGKIMKEDIQNPFYSRHEILGFNYRLSEVCAAVALGQLRNLENLVEKRKNIAHLFNEVVTSCNWLKTQNIPEGHESTYWCFPIQLDSDHISWAKFRETFLGHGGDPYYGAWRLTYMEPLFQRINTNIGNYFSMLCSRSNVSTYNEGLCPIAESTQPNLIQLKTNYFDDESIKKQVIALKRTIEELS